MAYPIFESFSLSTDNYIIEDINYRTIPVRELVMESITRRPGKKLVSHEFAERRIKMAGWILGSDASDLQTKIDDFHTAVTRKETGLLELQSDRNIEATVALVAISDRHYSQTIVPLEIEFVATQPFYQGAQQTVEQAVAASTTTKSITLTVSGSVFAEPLIKYTAAAGTGASNLKSIIITYSPTSETLTWSGGGDTLALGSYVQFDYSNQIILEGGTEVDPSGVYSRFEPGSTTITVEFRGTTTSTSLTTTSTSSTTTSSSTTHSGTTTSKSTSSTTRSTSTTTTLYPGATGGTLEIAYRPRYL